MHLDVIILIMFASNDDFLRTNPTEKRVGVIRTFHHKLYENDEWSKKSTFSKISHYYCYEHWKFCLLISISIAIMVAGALSTIYGYLLPSLYKSLDMEESKYVQFTDNEKAVKYKDLFVVVGISLSGVGLVLCVTGACFPVYKDSMDVDKYAVQHTPIVVDYELPPYDTTLENANYKLIDNEFGDAEAYMVLENDVFQTYLVQEKIQS